MYTFESSIIGTPPPQEICGFGAARITGQGGGAFLPSAPRALIPLMYVLTKDVYTVHCTEAVLNDLQLELHLYMLLLEL